MTYLVETFHFINGKTYRRMVKECRCRDCGYTFRVSTDDDYKFERENLCKVCYYAPGHGHEREEMCAFPKCEEVVEGRHKYCDAHGKLMSYNSRMDRRAVQQIAAAIECESRAEVSAAVRAMQAV